MGKMIGSSLGVVFTETLLTRREIYHVQELGEYLNTATHARQELISLLRLLWGQQGMDSHTIVQAANGWATG